MPLPDAFNGPGPPPDPGREDHQWSSAREGHVTSRVTSPSRDNLAADFICAHAPRVSLSKIPVRSSSKMETSDSRTQSRQSSNSTPDSSPRSSSAPLLNVCSKIPITPRMSKSLHSTRKRKRSKIPKSKGTQNDGKKFGYMYIPTPTFVQETTISPNMESPRSTKEQFSRLPVLKRPDTSRMRMELSISDSAPVEIIDDSAPVATIDHVSVEQEKEKIEFQEIIISKEVEIRRKLRIHDEFIEAMLENRTVFDQLAFGLRELYMKVDEQDGKAISDSHCMEMVQFQSLCSQAEEVERKFARIQQEFIGKELEPPTPDKTHAEVNAHEVKLLFDKIHEAEQSTTVDTINEAQITSLVEEFVMGSATDTYKVHGHDSFVESKPGQIISIDDIMDKYKLNEYQANYGPGIVVKSSEAAIDTFDIDKYESMRECTKHIQVLPSIAEVPDENAEYTINGANIHTWLTGYDEPPDSPDCDTSSCQSIELRSPIPVIARLDISDDLHAMRKELMSKYSSADESSPENETDMVNDNETNESNLVHAWNEYSELTDDDEVGNMLEAIKCMKKHATSGLLNVQDTIDKMLDKFVGGNDVPEDDVTETGAVSETDPEEVCENDVAQTDAGVESETEIHGDDVAQTLSETYPEVPEDDDAQTDAVIETDPEDNVEKIDSVMSEQSETPDKSLEETDDESSPADLADIMQGRETDFRTETCSITVAPSVDIDDAMVTDKSIPEILAHLNALEDDRLLMMGEFSEDRKQREKRTRKVLQFWVTTARFNVHEATEILRLATCTPEDTRPESYSMNGVMEMLYNASSTDALKVIEEICQLNTEKSNAQLMIELEKGLTYHKMKLDGGDKAVIVESESEMCLYDIHQLFKTEYDSMLSDVTSHKSEDIMVLGPESDEWLIDIQRLFEHEDNSKTSATAAFGTETLFESEDNVTQSEDYKLVKGHLESEDNISENDNSQSKRVKSPDIMIDNLVGDSVQNSSKSEEESEIHEDLGRENEINTEQLFALKYRDKDSKCKSAPIENIKPDVYVSKSLDAMEFKALKLPDIKELEVASANKSGVTNDTSISDDEEKIRQCDDASKEMHTEENPVVKLTDPHDDKHTSSETIIYTDNSVILNDGAIECLEERMASDRYIDSLKKITDTVVEMQHTPTYYSTSDHPREESGLRDTELKSLDIIGQRVDQKRSEKKEKFVEMPAPEKPSVNVKLIDEPPLKVVYLLHNPRKSVLPLPEHTQNVEDVMTKKPTSAALVRDSNILRNESPLQGPQAKSIFKSNERNYERFEEHADALKPSTSREVRKPNFSRKYETKNMKEGKNEAKGDLMDLRINGTNLNEPRPIKKKNRIVRSSGAIKLITKNDLPDIKMSKKVSPEVERTKQAILEDGFSPMLQRSPARRSINSGSYSDMRRSLNPHQPLPSIYQNADQQRDFRGTPNTTTDYAATPQSDFMATPLPAIKSRRNKKY